MKKELKTILVGFFVFALFYLVGSFVESDFNIKNWEPGARALVGIYGGITAAFLSVAYATFPTDQ